MTTKEAILSHINKVDIDFFKQQRDRGINASGKSEAGAEIAATDTAGELKVFHYVWTNLTGVGRKPGKFPPLEMIRNWIASKGIVPRDISMNSLVYLIARKISRKGTDIFQNKRVGISLDEAVSKNEPEFVTNITEIGFKKIDAEITKAFMAGGNVTITQ